MATLRRTPTLLGFVAVLAVACAGNPDKRTLAELQRVEPDMREVTLEGGLERAMQGYRRYLEEAPESALTPEAMRRLADLKLEKEYGILGDGGPVALPAPEAEGVDARRSSQAAPPVVTTGQAPESEQAFEQRAVASDSIAAAEVAEVGLPEGQGVSDKGPLEAIALYDQILAAYPDYEHNDRVLYQKARAFDELGQPDDAIAVTEKLIARYPYSRHIDEVQFRRAEYFFTRRHYIDAEEAYQAVTDRGPVSNFYELALYKLGWTLYKQEMYEEALDQYVELLDHKVATGYDFDQSDDEDAGRRIADTFRVVSLSFSVVGGPEAVTRYFAEHGERTYEDRVYRHLGEFFLDKLRYQDAAGSYEAFVNLHPMHRSAPHFGMRVVEIYEVGGFPKLVLSSKKAFSARYDLTSSYWQHNAIDEAGEVVDYLKTTLGDLANHYHAAYQDLEREEERAESFAEAGRWYRAYLTSFPQDEETPAIHHQLADLLLEHEDFGQAALEYEHTAYAYPSHEKAAGAGYAAIYAHRQHQEQASPGEAQDTVRLAAVASTLRFVDRFPEHEHAPIVLGTAVDDLYEMGQLEAAIETGRRLIDDYPAADAAIVRSAWLAVAHAAFDLADYSQAEQAYAVVLERTGAEDESREAIVDNLAASIYQQGDKALAAGDHRSAADHFLRIAEVAPSSPIRAGAEYDAGAALIVLEDWDAAIRVLDRFRETHPEHELQGEATRKLATVYRGQGQLSLAAAEYELIAAEADEEELRREALLVAAELYEEAGVLDRALDVFRRYVERYPEPLELAVEARFKIAELYEGMGDSESRHAELRRIVEIDRGAGAERTDRIRTLAARSALVLTESLFDRFAEVKLVLPFARSLKQKQRRMDEALSGFGRLVDYEVGDVTSAATFYMAEIYRDFSQSLLDSERPSDLSEAEMLDYELVLEEEAFPFEEKAIEVHEKNLELMGAGIYNRWIERSLAKLAEVMPGRYAKFEESSGLVASIDRYAYAAPTLTPVAVSEIPELAPAELEQIAPLDVEPIAPGPAAPAPMDPVERERPVEIDREWSPEPVPEPAPAPAPVTEPVTEPPTEPTGADDVAGR